MNTIIKHAAKNKKWTWFRLLCQITSLAMVLLTAFGFTQPTYAASLSVNTTTDELNNDGDCSLREAIQAANTNAVVDACIAGSGNDTIYLSSGTYVININGSGEDANLTGDFDITAAETLLIVGSGSGATIIDGGFGDRVFHLTNAGGTLQLVSLTVQNGLTFDEPGAGVLSWGTLVLNYVNVQQNGILGSSSSAVGGGLCVGCITGTGYLTIYDSVIRNNSAKIAGGIFTNVIGIIDRSSIISNTATLNPGGIANYGTLAIYNSLVSDNTGNALGSSGIFNQGTLTLSNSTISHNLADPGFTGVANNGTLITSNTILANNTPLNCVNTGSFSSQGHNLSSDNSCSTFLNAAGDLNNADPLLGALQQSTGLIYFRPLLAGSPAIDAGNNSSCLNHDQFLTHRPLDGDGNGTRLCDIGAYELPGATFADVPVTNFAWNYVERLYTAGITGGCGISPLIYCPNNSVTRAQMAVFLLRGMHGSSYVPPAATGTVFGDVPVTHPQAAWIEQLNAEGITGGCGGGNYCPANSVTRAQMAVFLLRAKHGSAYIPPVASGTMFADVPITHPQAAWIEQLSNEGVTGGCGAGNYCPANPVTRAQMAIFLVRAFSLP